MSSAVNKGLGLSQLGQLELNAIYDHLPTLPCNTSAPGFYQKLPKQRRFRMCVILWKGRRHHSSYLVVVVVAVLVVAVVVEVEVEAEVVVAGRERGRDRGRCSVSCIAAFRDS